MATQVQKLQARISQLENVTKKHQQIIDLLISDEFIEKIKNSIDTAFNSFDAVEVAQPATSINESLKQQLEQQRS